MDVLSRGYGSSVQYGAWWSVRMGSSVWTCTRSCVSWLRRRYQEYRHTPGPHAAYPWVRTQLAVAAVKRQADVIIEGLCWCGPGGAEAYARRHETRPGDTGPFNTMQAAEFAHMYKKHQWRCFQWRDDYASMFLE